MPFKSSAQMRAAFGGYLGPEMKAKAPEFAHATPNLKDLPQHVATPKHKAMHKKAMISQMKDRVEDRREHEAKGK